MKKHLQQIFLSAFVVSVLMLVITTDVDAAIAPLNVKDYAKIYKKQCATCHGNTGNGKGRAGASFNSRPTDFTSAQSKQMLSLDRIINATRDGIAGTSMVAYGRRFDEEMLLGLANFIQVEFMGRFILTAEKSQDSMLGSFQNEADVKTAENDKADIGRKIYIDNCSACHGDKGESAVWARNGLMPPPRNFTLPKAKEELSRLRMITSVTHGRPGTAMMSFAKRLNEKEIEQVVDFIRANFFLKDEMTKDFKVDGFEQNRRKKLLPEHEKTTSHGNMPLPENIKQILNKANQQDFFAKKMPDGLVGDPIAGKKFYNNNCFVCHGKLGNGKGPRAHFNYPRPRDFTSIESHDMFNRPLLFSSISKGKRGSVMPAWATVLSKQEIADVAEYVFQQFIIKVELKKKK